jgi:geranylgeranyl pyrophosphate synthase
MTMHTTTTPTLAQWRTRIDQILDEQLAINHSSNNASLTEAMHYAVFNGGKRIRPLLVYASGYWQGVKPHFLDAAATAVELVHCYSLVHDDLPAMDDDDLRRGKPTCHKAFDEATAILVGDALQSLAFELMLANNDLPVGTCHRMALTLAQAIGRHGMAGGQSLDLAAVENSLNQQQLETLHSRKTGALIACALQMGALAAEASNNQLEQLTTLGYTLGLAFQVQDDVLDVESSTKVLGKQQGADVKAGKTTYPKLLGLDKAKRYRDSLFSQARSMIDQSPNNGPITELITLIAQRDH